MWLRRLHGNWQCAARIPRILQWLLAGLMLIIGLAVGILGAKLALVGGTLYFALMGVVMVIAAVLIFPQPPRRYSVIRRGVYRLGDLGD